MRIERLSIDAFGHFTGVEFGPFESGIVVIHGPNESGKTTLLAFIQAILFGFPNRNEATFIPALNGGKRAGRLMLIDENGARYTVERQDGTHRGPVVVTASDGLEMDGGCLSALLDNTSRDIFQNVYAFGLDQLTTVDSLHGKEISSQMYGVVSGTERLPAALRDLTNSAGAIFRPGGSTQPVYHLLTQLDEIDKQLREQKDDAQEYGRLQTELDRFTSQSRELRDTYQRLRNERAEIDAVLDAEKAVQQARKQLEAQQHVPEVDDERVTARRSVISEAERSNARLTVLRQQLDHEEQHLSAIGAAGSPLASLALLFVAGIAIAVGTVAGGVALVVSITVALLLGALAVALFLGHQRRSSTRVTQKQRVDHTRSACMAERDRLTTLLRQAGINETTDIAHALSAARGAIDALGDSQRSHADRIAWLESQLAEREAAFVEARSVLTIDAGVDLEVRAAAIDAELDRTDALRAERDQLIGKTREAIRRLEEGTGAVAALRAEQERLLEELREAAAEWSGYMLAHEILTRSRKRFEEEHQPGVIRTARSYLDTVTAGKYDRIIVSPDRKEIEVFQPNGASKRDSELSRGAREQLYLALRFGYITELGRLPVIVDDILVNFDPARSRATAHAFAELSRTNQILVFTCHPSTVEYFRSASPDVQVIELETRAIAHR